MELNVKKDDILIIITDGVLGIWMKVRLRKLFEEESMGS